MAACSRAPSAAVVSQRLCDVLYAFPSAAASGIQWSTLVRKYEERYSTRLDISALGHESPLAAATALLWDVLRLVDRDDTDNPVVAVEDAIALTPRPGAAASWPSLYRVLVEAIQEAPSEVLLSKLKPLLQSHWHPNFDETALGYLTDEGTFVKVKKMKHLLLAVLRWRDQRLEWQASNGSRSSSELDDSLACRLELVPSKTHNDFILRRCSSVVPQQPSSPLQAPCPRDRARSAHCSFEASTSSDDLDAKSAASSSADSELQQELARLRAENAMLQERNRHLELQGSSSSGSLGVTSPEPPARIVEVFDDPFEPPPECRPWDLHSPMASSTVASSSGSQTPLSSMLFADFSSSASHSGSSTPRGLALPMAGALPAPQAAARLASAFPAHGHGVCAFMPVWLPFGDRASIRSGMVQEACKYFERGSTVLPSFFARDQRQ